MCRDDAAIVLVDRWFSYVSIILPLEEDGEKKIKIIDRAIKKIKTHRGYTRFCNWMIGRSGEELDKEDCWIIIQNLKNTEHKLYSEHIKTVRYLYIKNIDTELTVTLGVRRYDDILNQYEADLMLVPDSWRKYVGKDISWT